MKTASKRNGKWKSPFEWICLSQISRYPITLRILLKQKQKQAQSKGNYDVTIHE